MWTGIAALGGALISSYSGASASEDASAAQQQGLEQSMGMQRQMYGETKQNLSGYLSGGQAAFGALLQRLGFQDPNGTGSPTFRSTSEINNSAAFRELTDPIYAKYGRPNAASQVGSMAGNPLDIQANQEASNAWNMSQGTQNESNTPGFGSLLKKFTLDDFNRDPSYLFRQAEGEKALGRASAARGLSASTPGMKDLMRFNQDLASTEYGNAFARDQAEKGFTFNALNTVANAGQSAAATMAGVTSNFGSSVGNAMVGVGNAQANGILGSASAVNNGVQGGLGNYMYQQRYQNQMDTMKSIFAPKTGGGAANGGPIDPYNYNLNYG